MSAIRTHLWRVVSEFRVTTQSAMRKEVLYVPARTIEEAIKSVRNRLPCDQVSEVSLISDDGAFVDLDLLNEECK